MIRLTQTLQAWDTPEFDSIFKREFQSLDVGQLPLQQGLSTGSYSLDGELEAMVIGVSDEENRLRVKAGIFYASIIGGCACADDPAPVNEEREYCVVRLDIDKVTAETTITLLTET